MEDHDEHMMSPMMDIIHILGVAAADSADDCAQVIKNTPKTPTKFGESYKPPFFKVYG